MKALLALALTAAAQPQAQQFDLICNGTVTSVGHSTTRRYHVDLVANKWCAGDPCAVRPIADVLPDVIWFERQRIETGADVNVSHYVSRVTGGWYWQLGPMVTEGTCERAPFSGFPKLETKF